MREKAKEMPDGVITLQHQAIFTMIFQEYLVLIFQFEEMYMVVHSQEFTILNVQIARIHNDSIFIERDIPSVK